MGRKLYIADWHYGHKNILAYDHRPFFTVNEMNSTLIQRWNQAVNKDDVVYILGDMFWCPAKEAISVIDQLNGTKILVKGNHDRATDSEFSKRFAKIDDYMEIEDEGNKVILCHYPIPCFKNHFYGSIHLYGHVHNSFEANMMEHNRWLMENLYGNACRMHNVGAMMPYMDYTPRTLQEILESDTERGEIGGKEAISDV